MALIRIWGDESSQNAHQYMVLGTIWENPAFDEELQEEVEVLRHKTQFFGEFNWKAIKKFRKDAYLGLVDLFAKFMEKGALKFRALIVDMSNKKNIKAGDDHELHFYKMFFWLIYKRLNPHHRYDIFLDRKSNSVPGRLKDLERFLNKKFVDDYFTQHLERIKSTPEKFVAHDFPESAAIVRRVEPRDGSQIQLQMADVFAGAIAYVWNGYYEKAVKNHFTNPKSQIVDHIEQTIGFSLKTCHRSSESDHFNIWCFERK